MRRKNKFCEVCRGRSGPGLVLPSDRVRGLPSHLDEIIANHNEFDAELRNAYLREHIRFDLGEPEKQGIAEFVRRLRAVSTDPVFDPHFISAG